MVGFNRLALSRCVEPSGTHLLLAKWRRLEDHIEGFRGSPQYQKWRRLLHHFYDPLPTVEHSRRSTPSEPLRVPVRDPHPNAGRIFTRFLPGVDTDMAVASSRERLSIPSTPATNEPHLSDPRHEVHFARPDESA